MLLLTHYICTVHNVLLISIFLVAPPLPVSPLPLCLLPPYSLCIQAGLQADSLLQSEGTRTMAGQGETHPTSAQFNLNMSWSLT